jgi:hypothetical protein
MKANTMDLVLLTAVGTQGEQLQMITRQFCRDLSTELGLDSRLPEKAAEVGQRGDPVTVGAVLVALAKSGTILGFLRLVQSYISRVPSLEMSVVRADGSRFSLKASNLTETQLQTTEQTLTRFWDTAARNE